MEFQLLTFINQFGHGTPLLGTGQARLDIFSQYVSWDISMLIIRVTVIIVALLFKKRYRKTILMSFIFAGILFYGVVEIGFKKILTQEIGIRPRPYIAYSTTIHPIGKPYSDSSFPSSHMVLTVSMITVLIILFPSVWPYAILYALLMAWSRMYNGMHYPSDILAGVGMGILCGWLAVVVSKKILPIKKEAKAFTINP